MSDSKIGRRSFMQGAGLVALSATGIISANASEEIAVPNSSGTEPPKLKAPPHACDCHHHIYDGARFPFVLPGAVPHSSAAEYRLLQRRIGTQRDIVVTPRAYGTDNRATLDTIAQFAPNARGVAVIDPKITDAQLDELHRGGIRGIRFSLSANPATIAVSRLDMIEPLSKRVARLGWHIQLNMEADQIAEAGDLWNRVPVPMVFDHMGHIPKPAGIQHPTYAIIRRLVDKGQTWVKLSVMEVDSKVGRPTYSDITEVAKSYVRAAPERMVWGSNWPHPNEDNKPDDATLFDLVAQWAPSAAMQHRILVENPEALYGFAKSS